MDPLISHSKPSITLSDETSTLTILRMGMIARGNKVADFENTVSNYLDLESGLATSSGTSAIFLALKALGVTTGDEIILPTYICPTVLLATVSIGATPVLCDVSKYWNMDCNSVQGLITSKTKAIIVPHLYGIAADVEPITQLGVPVIEDIAQAFGAQINRRKIGTFGQLTVCSFQATKCLTTGEGGMVLSNNEDYIQRIRSMQSLFPMSDLQASLGISQIEQYNKFLEIRKVIAYKYFESLENIENICMPPSLRQRSMFFRFPLMVPLPFDFLKKQFEQKNIAVRKGVDSLLHRSMGLSPKDFPNAERCFKETISIPIYPSLSDTQVEYIAQTSAQIFTHCLKSVNKDQQKEDFQSC